MKGSSERPNIVIVNPDQMRADYASCYGHPFINTRHLDHLSSIGTRYDQAYTAAPMCGPSRTSFLTGRYPMEHGVRNYGGTLDPSTPNALANLGKAGYIRGLWGKDHVFAGKVIGEHYDEGENICLGIMTDHPAYRRAWDCAVQDKGSPWNLTKRLTDEGLDFIDRHADGPQPFYLTLNYQDPHPFFTCPEPYSSLFHEDQFSLPPNYRRYKVKGEIRRLTHWRIHAGETDMPAEELKRAMAIYCGQIRYVDDQLGRILEKLTTLNLLENTIVLFWSDHGEFIGDFGVTHKMPAFFDCLMRVPLVLWDPTGTIQRGIKTEPVELMDAMATILDLCGVSQPEGSRARSMTSDRAPRRDVFADAGLLVQQPGEPIHGLILKGAQPPTAFGPGAMLRTEEWKLCLYADDLGELYNLRNDPHETSNRYNDPGCANIRAELAQRLVQRMLCCGQAPEDLPHGNIPDF